MSSNRKALCVGINNYKNFSGSSLQGCVNDVGSVEDVLKKLLSFQSSDIVKLTNAEATKANIMQHLKSMVHDAKAGKLNYLIFTMSSHGTQVPDRNNDEPDRYDEAFCPYDLAAKGGAWDPKYIITDDELHDLFVQLPPNVLLEVYLDTCHSGTGLKALDFLPDRKPRLMLPPTYEALIEVENKLPRGLHRILLEKGIVHHILWAACRADQTAADAYISGGWHGAFTYYWCKVMLDTQNKLSRTEVLKRVNTYLRNGHYNQIVQLEGEATVRSKEVA